MGIGCSKAFGKCVKEFGSDSKKIGAAIDGYKSGTSPTSCFATMYVVGMMAAPGKPLTGVGVQTPAEAISRLKTLLQGDELIFVNIAPDHHFILFPLDRTEVGILQGFQSDPSADGTTGYSLFEWLQSGKEKIPVEAFLANFKLLFSGSKAYRQSAAQALFSISGSESYVAGWYKNQASITSMETAPVG